MWGDSASAIQWLYDSGTDVVGHADGVMVVMPYDHPTPASLDRLASVIEETSKERATSGRSRHQRSGTIRATVADPSTLALLMIFPEQPILPEPVIKAAIQDMLHRTRPLLGATSVLVPGQGFGAAAQRGAITAVFMFAKMPQLKVFACGGDAVDWACDHTGSSVDRASLLRTIVARASTLPKAV